MTAIAFPCPRCGQSYTLDHAYLSQYGGQTTNCSNCQGPMNLPTVDALRAPPAAPPPHAGGYAQAYAPVAQYGVPPAQYGAAPGVVAYATPPSFSSSVPAPGIWKDGKNVLLVSGTPLPDVCVKCGQPGDGHRFKRTMYWHSPLVFLALLVGPLIYVIVALVVRQSARIEYSLCAAHRAKRRNGILAGVAVAGLGIVLFFVVGLELLDETTGMVPLGILLLIAGLIISLVCSRTLSPKKIDRGYVWLTGVGKGFREVLPPAR